MAAFRTQVMVATQPAAVDSVAEMEIYPPGAADMEALEGPPLSLEATAGAAEQEG